MYSHSRLLICTVLLSSFFCTKQAIAQREENFFQYQDSLYKLVNGPTWEEAQAAAVALGGHLVTIEDESENSWLAATLDPLFEEPEASSVWLGLNDRLVEGQWEWVSGSEAAYRNWAPGEPDGQENYKSNEDYAELLLFDSFNRSVGDWGDHSLVGSGVGVAEIKNEFRLGSSLYKLVYGPTWEEAEAAAVALGGHLATIEDEAENTWLATTLDPIFEDPLASSVWIGLTDRETEGDWVWSSGSASAYRNWAPGEPDGQEIYKGNEDYAELLLFNSFNRSVGDWGDHSLVASGYGIAEITVPEPSAIVLVIMGALGSLSISRRVPLLACPAVRSACFVSILMNHDEEQTRVSTNQSAGGAVTRGSRFR